MTTRTRAFLASVLVLSALTAASSPAGAQVRQLDDSTFVPTVAAPAFTARHPQVLFDEAHHNFHTLNGRYRAFAALLAADGLALTANEKPFSAKTLAGHDLLVIANAMGDDPATGTDSTVALSAFSTEEIEAVYRWVEGGGALLLIADHTPFGSAAASLGARFGVDMSRGYACDSAQAFTPGSITNIEFTRARRTLGDHPIVNGRNAAERIDKIVAFTGQSLRGPAGSTPIMLLSDTAVDLPPEALALRGDPDAMMAKAIPAKGRSMAVALTVGRGRVVVQGEAGMLSAQVVVRPDQAPHKFGMNQPGIDNQRYALNLARWLARADGATSR